MRCLNCGWDNQPNAVTCIKCGQPVAGAAQPSPAPSYAAPTPGEAPARATVVFRDGVPQQEPQPKATVVFRDGVPQQEPQPRPTRIMSDNQAQTPHANVPGACPRCGYPVAQGATDCPNCGAPIAASQQPAQPAQPERKPASTPKADKGFDLPTTTVCSKCGQEVSIENKFCPHCGERIHLSTIQVPRHRKEPVVKCSLTLIPEEDEDLQPTPQEFTGKDIILTRENTEPDNRTITSKQQAQLTFEDGHWYIDNKSELGSTYIQVTKKTELQPGDIIMLGDRRFTFQAPQTTDKA